MRLRAPSDLDAVPPDWPYPALLKPAHSLAGRGILPVESADALRGAFAAARGEHVLQERLEGEDLELTILCDRGRTLAASAYRAVRSFPRRFGPPVAAETVDDEDAVAIASRLLQAIGYHGVAHLDMRHDRRDGVPKLLDFNARLAGTDEISTASGVSFAWLLYAMALGRPVGEGLRGKPGVRFRWLFYGELLWALEGPNRLRSLASVLRDRRGATNAWWSDPLPQAAQTLSGLVRRR